MFADLNWAHLTKEEKSDNAEKRLAWEEVRGSFRKIAWDVYKSTDASETLWELREDEDGKKYLYAMYEQEPLKVETQDEAPSLKSTAASDWRTLCDRDRKNVTLSFKGIPLKRFASAEYNFKPDEAEVFARFIQEKTAEPEFLGKILKDLPASTTEALSALKMTKSEE